MSKGVNTLRPKGDYWAGSVVYKVTEKSTTHY